MMASSEFLTNQFSVIMIIMIMLMMQGRSYMITGCNSGIGKQTALEIGKRGGTVHMVCRNPETAGEARSVTRIHL